jgi:hypothetical protein
MYNCYRNKLCLLGGLVPETRSVSAGVQTLSFTSKWHDSLPQTAGELIVLSGWSGCSRGAY